MHALKSLAPFARAIMLFALLVTVTSARADAPQESEVRAAMIFNLLKFAKWPETLAANAPLRICAIETTAPLVAALQALEQRNAGSHPLAIIIASNNDLAACEVIVSDSTHIAYALAAAHERGTLTIGEAGFIDRGGMIGITVIANRVRFEVNLEAMKRSGISLPSQVLQLAVRTR